MVVRFMNHILMPDQPSQVRIEVVTMLIRSYLGLRSINWAKVLRDLSMRLIRGIYNSRGFPLTTFSTHIYYHLDILMVEEMSLYIDTYWEWEFDLVDEPIVVSSMQMEAMKEK